MEGGAFLKGPSITRRRVCLRYSPVMVFLSPCQVLKWVEETVQAMKVHLLSSNHDSAQENKWEVPFDPSLREVTVSLSGPAPQIELSDPLGRHITIHHTLIFPAMLNNSDIF